MPHSVGPSQPPVVLLVEDEPSTRRLIQKHLTQNGYEVLVASHVQAAMELLGVSAPDVVCVDLVLPRESGYDLCEYMRKSGSYKEVPIVALGNRDSPIDRAHAEEAGASVYLVKPRDVSNLPRVIEALLSTRRTSSNGH